MSLPPETISSSSMPSILPAYATTIMHIHAAIEPIVAKAIVSMT